MIVPFSDWSPDSPVLGNTGNIKNAIPHITSYKKFPRMVAYSDALTAYCRGAYSATDNDGNSVTYAGDETKLYGLIGTGMTDYSKSGGYACASDSYWEFIKYGNKCIATNFDDPMQIITLGDSQFADLSGSPPRARHLSVVGRFVVVGNTFDGVDGNVPYRVRWAGFDDETAWTVSVTTQSDYQDLKGEGGWVQSIVGGERGVIFQERSISLMSYIGSPVVFQIDNVEDARGALSSGSVIKVGNLIFFIADDGFYQFYGGQSVPIGMGKVDKTFLSDVNEDFLHRMSSASIPKDKVIIWSYPSVNSPDGTPDKCILYNWVSKKWCYAEFDHELIFRALSVGVTLDGLDALGYTDIDAMTFSLDSKVWMGGAIKLSGFDTDHKLSYFEGSALAATFETGEVQVIEGKRAEVSELTPLVDGGSHTVQVGTRETQANTVSWGSVSNENGSGICPVRSNSRYHQFRVNVTGEFIDAMGVKLDKAFPSGER